MRALSVTISLQRKPSVTLLYHEKNQGGQAMKRFRSQDHLKMGKTLRWPCAVDWAISLQ